MSINKNIKNINDNIKEFNTNISNIVKSKLPLQLQYILSVYFLGLFFMLLYRFAGYAIHCFVSFSDINPILLLRSLLVGIRFDSIVLCWILAVFLIAMAVGAIFNINKKWFYRSLHILICFVFIIVYCLIAIDLAYFTYFKSHINIIVLSWVQSPAYISSIIVRHPVVLLYFAIFMISLAWYIWLMYCLYNATLFKVIPPFVQERKLSKTILVSVLLFALCGLGMYGRITERKPLGVSSAAFCDSNFFNQLAVSPLFNLEKSIEEEVFQNIPPLTVIDGGTTRETVKQQMISQTDIPSSTIALPKSTSIVMVLMEDITLSDVNSKQMPYLSSLTDNALSFTNVYPDGENIYNGVFSTLFAYPNILSANSMNSVITAKFSGLPNVLKEKTYKTLFITRQQKNGNDMIRFLYRNDFDDVIAETNITAEDEVEEISKLTDTFLSCILVSNNSQDQHIKNTDNHIKKLINSAKQTAWFKSTVFVFVGCNGKDKIPFIVYMPSVIKYSTNDNLACQTDIAPTILAMADKSYLNENTLGLNIFGGQRTYAISSYPHYAVAQDSVWKYVWRDSGHESLYYRGSDKENKNYIKAYSQQAENMKTYLFSMLQYTQYSISQMKLTRK